MAWSPRSPWEAESSPTGTRVPGAARGSRQRSSIGVNEWTDVPALGVKGNITTEKLRPGCGRSAENWPECCRLSPAGEPTVQLLCFKNEIAPVPSPPNPTPDEKPFVTATLVQSKVPAQRNPLLRSDLPCQKQAQTVHVVAAEQAG